jgi:hypothetical protein
MTPSDTGGRNHDDKSAPSSEIGLVPDFVDENIRAEMASLSYQSSGQLNPSHDPRRDEDLEGARYEDDLMRNPSFDPPFSSSASASFGSDTDGEDDVDELELQRLTRERGFGLGSWVDRLVEWTLFSVDEEVPETDLPVLHPGSAESSCPPQEFESCRDSDHDDSDAERQDQHVAKPGDSVTALPIEKPSGEGGWSDASWLFRIAKNSVL